MVDVRKAVDKTSLQLQASSVSTFKGEGVIPKVKSRPISKLIGEEGKVLSQLEKVIPTPAISNNFRNSPEAKLFELIDSYPLAPKSILTTHN
ncbi:twitching motility protein [Corchorus olitorius]|uniref:Twitching motility protein n=1 Tax=Corchorus olitorius TaxID=93759 RepID=A0A1R3KW32_9ROSI|nr:twitching motility protein [Corchorus olitorius]